MKKWNMPRIVTAAVIEKDGRVLIARRKQGSMFAGKWEFPGGKMEKGETPEQCLKRELQEELTVLADIGDLMCVSEHSYSPDWTILLMAYRAKIISGVFNLNDHEEIRWVKPGDLIKYEFPDADKPIVEKLMKDRCND